MKYVGLKTRPTDLVTQDQLSVSNSIPSGYRVDIVGNGSNSNNISLPIAPVTVSSIMLFRGMYQSLVSISDYSVNNTILTLTDSLTVGESLSVVYIGVGLSDAQLLADIGNTDTNFVNVFNNALL